MVQGGTYRSLDGRPGCCVRQGRSEDPWQYVPFRIPVSYMRKPDPFSAALREGRSMHRHFVSDGIRWNQDTACQANIIYLPCILNYYQPATFCEALVLRSCWNPVFRLVIKCSACLAGHARDDELDLERQRHPCLSTGTVSNGGPPGKMVGDGGLFGGASPLIFFIHKSCPPMCEASCPPEKKFYIWLHVCEAISTLGHKNSLFQLPLDVKFCPACRCWLFPHATMKGWRI